MLKFKADFKTIVYIIVTTSLFAVQWNFGFYWWLYFIYLHFSVAVAVIVHNHTHISIWKNKWLNLLTNGWLTVFYGVPVFTWTPTHQRNHHRYNNKPGDSSITYRHFNDNHLLSLLTYPTSAGVFQLKESILPYLKHIKINDRQKWIECMAEVAFLTVWNIGFLIVDWQKALLFVIIPQQVASFTVFVFNYVQHVHADEHSKYNHSRNFLWVNFFLFNNGYHTIHHEKPNLHWSELKWEHEKVAHLIHPSLIQKSFWGYMFKTYVFSLFIPKYRSQPFRYNS